MKKKKILFGTISVLVIALIAVALLARAVVFPLKYKNEIQKYAKEYKIEPELVASVIHLRSNFDPKEYKKGQECGPMSLQDKSAQVIAKEMNFKEFNVENLDNPDISIKIGTWFMSKNYKNKNITELVEKLGGINFQEVKPNTEGEKKKKFWEEYYKKYFVEKIRKRAKIYKILYPTL